jgi:hypothetical protein
MFGQGGGQQAGGFGFGAAGAAKFGSGPGGGEVKWGSAARAQVIPRISA